MHAVCCIYPHIIGGPHACRYVPAYLRTAKSVPPLYDDKRLCITVRPPPIHIRLQLKLKDWEIDIQAALVSDSELAPEHKNHPPAKLENGGFEVGGKAAERGA